MKNDDTRRESLGGGGTFFLQSFYCLSPLKIDCYRNVDWMGTDGYGTVFTTLVMHTHHTSKSCTVNYPSQTPIIRHRHHVVIAIK